MSTTADAKSVTTLPVDHDALTDVPVWETHKRGKNWAATLTGINPAARGGLDREFWQRAHGNDHYYVLPATMQIGTAVEFAADCTTSSGKPQPHRWFGVVTDLTPQTLTLRQCDTAREAIGLAAQIATQLTPISEELHQQVLDLLNSKLTEPGQRWYASRHHNYATRGKRNGKIADWHFVLRTVGAARAEGLLPDTSPTTTDSTLISNQ